MEDLKSPGPMMITGDDAMALGKAIGDLLEGTALVSLSNDRAQRSRLRGLQRLMRYASDHPDRSVVLAIGEIGTDVIVPPHCKNSTDGSAAPAES